jgi:cysteine dioxygenase
MNNLYNIIVNIPDFHNAISCVQNYNDIDYKQYIKFTEHKYNRIKIKENDNFEIILICWMPGQETPIHDHAKNGCIMKVLEGSLHETIYHYHDKLILSEKILLGTTFINNKIGYHKIKSNEYSVSLHIYSPPNHIANKFITF